MPRKLTLAHASAYVIYSNGAAATEVKDFLHLMRRTSTGQLPPWYPILVGLLEPMALSRSGGPPVFLHFDGRACGVKLPIQERWPTATGYCFYTWLRAEGALQPPV